MLAALCPQVAFAMLLSAVSPAALAADEDNDCVPVAGIAPSIDRFLDRVAAAQAAGQGSLPIGDVLFGVTEIGADDQKDLDGREAVQLRAVNQDGGTYVNRGPGRITVEGVFAGRDTLFRIPAFVSGRYVLGDRTVTLIYDPASTVEVGESLIGIGFYRDMNHTLVTGDRLSFFFGSNNGDEPDRCYNVLRD